MDAVVALAAGIGLVLLSAVIQVVKRETAKGNLGRSSAVGLRTRATRSSDEAWLAGHIAAGPWLHRMAVTGCLVGGLELFIAFYLPPDESSPVPLDLALVGYSAAIVLLGIAARTADVAARSASR